MMTPPERKFGAYHQQAHISLSQRFRNFFTIIFFVSPLAGFALTILVATGHASPFIWDVTSHSRGTFDFLFRVTVYFLAYCGIVATGTSIGLIIADKSRILAPALGIWLLFSFLMLAQSLPSLFGALANFYDGFTWSTSGQWLLIGWIASCFGAILVLIELLRLRSFNRQKKNAMEFSGVVIKQMSNCSACQCALQDRLGIGLKGLYMSSLEYEVDRCVERLIDRLLGWLR